jgi:hypothetical protein
LGLKKRKEKKKKEKKSKDSSQPHDQKFTLGVTSSIAFKFQKEKNSGLK